MDKQPLFQARTGGYHTCRIPGLCVTRSGTVLATAEARRGHGGDYDDNDVLLRRSEDGGQTWSTPRVIVGNQTYGPGPISNCMMIGSRNEPVHLLFCHDYARVFHAISTDDGRTFSEPRDITSQLKGFNYPWRVIATGPGHGLELANGRLLAAVWLSDGSGREMGEGVRGHRPSVTTTMASDDGGMTWQTGEIICQHTDPGTMNPSEATLAVNPAGEIIINLRHEGSNHRRLVARSRDGLRGWSPPRPDPALLEPVCHASLITHPDGTLIFANPDNLEETFAPHPPFCDRKRLTVKLSVDGGDTWRVSRILEEGPAGYSDLAVLADGTVLCLYECGLIERMWDDRNVTLARFNLEWARELVPAWIRDQVRAFNA
ncbi:MAG: sialidase family protein [Opitutaceae bacterium]